MAFAAIVFDCDGVILDSVNAKTKAFAQIGASFSPEAEKGLTEYHLAHGGVSRYAKFAWMFKTFMGREITKEESAELGEKFSRLCLEGVKAAPFIPGFLDAYGALLGKLPMFVASGTPQEELREVLALRLPKGFNGVFGTPPAKHVLLQSIVEDNGLAPQEVVMVGDAITDFEAAKVVGTRFYGIGPFFADKNCPWHEDLTSFLNWLAPARPRAAKR